MCNGLNCENDSQYISPFRFSYKVICGRLGFPEVCCSEGNACKQSRPRQAKAQTYIPDKNPNDRSTERYGKSYVKTDIVRLVYIYQKFVKTLGHNVNCTMAVEQQNAL